MIGCWRWLAAVADDPRRRRVYVEQPLAPDDLVGHAELARVRLAAPLALDESIDPPGDVATAGSLGAAALVNVKPARLGGVIERTLALAESAARGPCRPSVPAGRLPRGDARDGRRAGHRADGRVRRWAAPHRPRSQLASTSTTTSPSRSDRRRRPHAAPDGPGIGRPAARAAGRGGGRPTPHPPVSAASNGPPPGGRSNAASGSAGGPARARLARTVGADRLDAGGRAPGAGPGLDPDGRAVGVDVGSLAAQGIEVTGRRSGGGAVLLEPGQSVWIDVLVPVGRRALGRRRGRSFPGWARRGLTALGRPRLAGAEVHAGGLVRTAASARVCFAGLGPGEVSIGGDKAVGLSQRRTRAGARFQCIVHQAWNPRRSAPSRVSTPPPCPRSSWSTAAPAPSSRPCSPPWAEPSSHHDVVIGGRLTSSSALPGGSPWLARSSTSRFRSTTVNGPSRSTARPSAGDLERWGPLEYWTTAAGDGDGIGGALTKRDDPASGLMFYISVEDVDQALASVEAAGGRRLTGRMPIPTVGWSAFFEDSEGNKVGVFQEDPEVPMPGGDEPEEHRPEEQRQA